MTTVHKDAYRIAIGSKIKEIREMTADEKDAYDWVDRGIALVIVLDNGFCLIPTSDQEANNPGDLNIEHTTFGGESSVAEPPIALPEVETIDDLRKYIAQVLPGTTVVLTDDGIVIRTGLDVEMGGTLHPINEED